MAETLNREILEPAMTEAIQRYTGKFIPKYGYNWDIVINEIYPIVQTNLPAIFFRNPKAYAKPRNKTFVAKVFNPNTGKKEDTVLDSLKSANVQEALLNYAVEKIKYKKEARKVLLDALLFPHGVLWHGYKGDFGMTEEQSLFVKDNNVFVKRLCPTRFIKDPNVTMSNLDEAKWVGRILDIPYIDLIEDDKLSVDKKLVKGFNGYGTKLPNPDGRPTGVVDEFGKAIRKGGGDDFRLDAVKNSLLDYMDKNFQTSKYSKFVRLYEIYKRHSKKEARKGEKGKIILLTFEQEKPLREDDWTVKAEGFPAIVLQFNELPDAQLGLPDIDTYKNIADQKNIITNLQLRNAQQNSKVYVAISKDDKSEEDVTKIQKGDQTILLFAGDDVNGKLSVQSAAGAASNELYLIDQRIQKNLDDKSGVTDLRRGVLQSGEESAASVKMRAANSSARPAYRQDLMADFLRDSFHYLNQLIKQYMPYEDAVRVMGSLDIQWSDKPSREEVQAEVDIEIDPISMLPENPDDELAKLNQILQLMFQALMNPQVQQKIAQEGMTINISPVIEQLLMRMKIRDPDIFRHIQPGESQGYASVEQLREAKDNVAAALTGQQIPHPPAPQDDHLAKLEIYTTVSQLTQMSGHISDVLEQLIRVQSALLQQQQEKEPMPGMPAKMMKPQKVTT